MKLKITLKLSLTFSRTNQCLRYSKPALDKTGSSFPASSLPSSVEHRDTGGDESISQKSTCDEKMRMSMTARQNVIARLKITWANNTGIRHGSSCTRTTHCHTCRQHFNADTKIRHDAHNNTLTWSRHFNSLYPIVPNGISRRKDDKRAFRHCFHSASTSKRLTNFLV